MDCELSEEFDVKLSMLQGSVLSLVFAFLVDAATPKILIVVDYCWRQLSQRLWLVAPAYLRKEDVTWNVQP